MSVSLSAKIPFQPGLSLGSIVSGDVIEKMEKYVETLSKIENVQKKIRDLEQESKAIQEKITSIGLQQKSECNKLLLIFYGKQSELIKKKISDLPTELANIQDIELPSFPNISIGLETPIDFDVTEIATDSRGFDSVAYSSQYIDMQQTSQKIQDKMNQDSSSSSVSVGAKFFGISAGVSHTWSKGAMDRVAEIKNQGYASKVMLINALVTTRNVRFLKNRSFDVVKLKNILDAMSVNEDELKKCGITVFNGKKCIYLLTEAVMGGSFSAIITYLKTDLTKRDVKDKSNHSSSSTSVDAGGSILGFGADVSYKNSRQKAGESHDDNIDNRGSLNINIEFISQGAIPQMARDTVVRETLKFQNQNLRKYHSSGSEESGKSTYARQAELQKAAYDTINTVQQTKVEREEIFIHSPNTVLKAYDDFCSEITNDSSAGIPIGFNYTRLTEEFIRNYVNSKEKKPEIPLLDMPSNREEKI